MRPLFALILCSALLGCGEYYHGYQYQRPSGPVIPVAPPEPLLEAVYACSYGGMIWVDGFWNWSGASYAWVSGRCLAPPRVGLYWYSGGYIRRGPGYVWVEGRWVPRGYRSRFRYVHWRQHQRRWGRHHSQGHSSSPAARRGPRAYPAVRHTAPPSGATTTSTAHSNRMRAPHGGRRHRTAPYQRRHTAPPASSAPRSHRAPMNRVHHSAPSNHVEPEAQGSSRRRRRHGVAGPGRSASPGRGGRGGRRGGRRGGGRRR